MKRLSPREEKVMQVLWQIGEGFVKDVIAHLPEPDTPYNTVSSIIRILEEKGYVGHKAYGRTYLYFPIVTLEEFRKRSFRDLIRDYFDDSVESVVSHMVQDETLGEQELDRIRRILEEAEKGKGEEK